MCLPGHTTCAAVIAAAWAAPTVLSNMKPCPNHCAPNYRLMKKKKPKARQELKPVRPSGKKDDNFFVLVFDLVRQVPRGRVTSYGAIAAALGTKGAARMVGWAMNSAHGIKPHVPAHRVVNRQGLLTGKMHFANPGQMQQLLEEEGVTVKEDQVMDFQKLFWDPVVEMGLD